MPYNWFRRRWRADRPERRVRRAWMIRKRRGYTLGEMVAYFKRYDGDREASVFSVDWWRFWGVSLQRVPWRLRRLFDERVVDPIYKAHNRLRHGHLSGELADINSYLAGVAAMGLRYWHHTNYRCVDYRDPDGHLVENRGQIPPEDLDRIDWRYVESDGRYYLTDRAVGDLVNAIATPLERYAQWDGWDNDRDDTEYHRRNAEARAAWRLWARYFPQFET